MVSRTDFIKAMTDICGEPKKGVIPARGENGGYPEADLLLWTVGNGIAVKLIYTPWSLNGDYSSWKIELIPPQDNDAILGMVTEMKSYVSR